MKIALIGCTKRKKDYACPARELYSESTLFKSAYAYAKIFADKIFILSAKYGLISEDEIISNYDQTLNHEKADVIKNWSEKVLKQMEESVDLQKDELIFLAGEKYRRYLIPLIQTKYHTKISLPLKDVGGIGKQVHWLQEKLNDE